MLADVEQQLGRLELTWRWACSLGEAELANALEQVRPPHHYTLHRGRLVAGAASAPSQNAIPPGRGSRDPTLRHEHFVSDAATAPGGRRRPQSKCLTARVLRVTFPPCRAAAGTRLQTIP